MKNKLTEKLYLNSPAAIKNLAVSIYGARLSYIRYGKKYKTIYRNIKNNYNFNAAEMNAYINKRLHATIEHAATRIPYYKNLFEEVGIGAKEIRQVEDLKKLPLLEKKELLKDPFKFKEISGKNRGVIEIHTTGTTGTPLKIFCDHAARKRNFAFFTRFLDDCGIEFNGKRATFWGRLVVPPDCDKPPFWCYSYFQKNLLLSSYHLNDENMPHYIKKMWQFRPAYIDAYPSSLYLIAKYAQDNHINLKGITKGLTTSAETLYSHQREIIEDAFKLPVYDQYGAAEMCVFVGQCKYGSYHIHTDYGILEFLRENGDWAEPGEEAELVCTGFINPVMPLIRYRIGDRGVLSKADCECGSPFPVMDRLAGRMDDVIITPDGRKIGRLSPVLKGFPVVEAQYVQNSLNELEIRIIPADGYSANTEKALNAEIKKRVGDQINLKFVYVDDIARGRGGKFRAVVSNIVHV